MAEPIVGASAGAALDEHTLRLLTQAGKRGDGPPFAPRERGAMYQRRYQVVEYQGTAGGQHFYFVLDQQWATRCLNVNCKLFGVPQVGVTGGTCPECAAPLDPFRPVHVLVEASTRKAFGTAPEVAARHVYHPGLHCPLDYFEESDGRHVRCCLVLPLASARDASQLIGRQDVPTVLGWGVQVARGLQALFAHGMAFKALTADRIVLGENGAALYGFDEMLLFPNAQSLAMQRAAQDNFEELLGVLWRLLTGQAGYAPGSGLPPRIESLFVGPGDEKALPSLPTWRKRVEALLLEMEAARDTGPLHELPVVLAVAQASDVGRVRKLNEDSVLAIVSQRLGKMGAQSMGVFVVADGMGGHAAGEVASGLVVETMMRRAYSDLFSTALHFKVESEMVVNWLTESLQAANATILAQRSNRDNDMGSTVVAAVVSGRTVWLAHLGDSRAYLLDGAQVTPLTVDHSLVAQLVSAGRLSEADARHHPQRNMIYKSIGSRAEVEPSVRMVTLSPGETLLLCSDGLNSMLEDGDIAAVVAGSASLDEAAARLVAAANVAGGYDNVSVVLIRAQSAAQGAANRAVTDG